MASQRIVEAAATKSASAISRLLAPKSVAIVGMSAKPGSPSRTVLHNLLSDNFTGDLHFVGRTEEVIEGRRCVPEISHLPKGIDLAILIVPAGAVRDTVTQCVRQDIGSAVCFASGFAEAGEDGLSQQHDIAQIARSGDLALLGPNCVGFYNYVHAFQAMLVQSTPIIPLDPARGPGLAVVTQSGGMGHHLAQTLQGRGVPISYMVTTGNEAGLELTDFAAHFLDDPHTAVVVAYAEQIRRPADMIAVGKLARARGKVVVLFHPGRTARAQAATASHTGALVGDHAAMLTVLEASGVLLVETLEEAIDIAELALRYPVPSAGGLGVVTTSGAITVIASDYCEGIGLDLPPLRSSDVRALQDILPDFIMPQNPLDISSVAVWKPDLLRDATKVLLAHHDIGSVLLSNPYVHGALGIAWAEGAAAHGRDKPLVYVVHDEDVALPADVEKTLRDGRVVVMRSPERAMRALGRLARYASSQTMSSDTSDDMMEVADLPAFTAGALPEWRSKEILLAFDIPVPPGMLARSGDEAAAIAAQIGYPVVIKVQSPQILHKTEVAGVVVGLRDEAELRAGYARLLDNVANARPDVVLDGILVEKMGEPGVELVVGARRDPTWGPVLVIGLGGVWIEALHDTLLLPADASQDTIIARLKQLKGASLLQGFRGANPVDLSAIALVVRKIGALMRSHAEITEIDINPLVANDHGVMALDALLVVE